MIWGYHYFWKQSDELSTFSQDEIFGFEIYGSKNDIFQFLDLKFFGNFTESNPQKKRQLRQMNDHIFHFLAGHFWVNEFPFVDGICDHFLEGYPNPEN